MRYTILIAALVLLNSPAETRGGQHWVGTWAAAAQPAAPGSAQTFNRQTLRLIVHASAGGTAVRITLSNTYGDRPLVIGAAHIARRRTDADIDPRSDRALTFRGHASTTILAHGAVVSDPVNLDVAPLSDLAVSLFLPQPSDATTTHALALQTSYVSTETGNSSAAVAFPIGKEIRSWPFLTAVDVAGPNHGATIVAFGSSLTDGDGTSVDTNGRFPDVLAARLQHDPNGRRLGVVNEGIIGNRLLRGSPGEGTPFGALLGEAAVTRFDRDVLARAGVQFVIVGLGINDIVFPGVFTPAGESVSADAIIAGLRHLILRAHRKGVRVIGTTNSPFENATFNGRDVGIYTPEREQMRQQVNAWILTSHAFDAVVDLDLALRDPTRPTRLLPAYDSGDHLHPNNAGCVVEGNAFPLSLFDGR